MRFSAPDRCKKSKVSLSQFSGYSPCTASRVCEWSLLLTGARVLVAVAGNDACWSSGFSYDVCCDLSQGPEGNVACWDSYFNFDFCCNGGFDPNVFWWGDPRVACLSSVFERTCSECTVFGSSVSLTKRLPDEGCPGRFFWFAEVLGVRGEGVEDHLPLWARPANMDAVERHMTMPSTFELRGGLCLPSFCDEHVAAAWIFPRLAASSKGEYDIETAVQTVNATHVRVSSPLATSMDWTDFGGLWMVKNSSTLDRPIGVVFATREHHHSWRLSPGRLQALLSIIAVVVMNSVFVTAWGSKSGWLHAVSVQGGVAKLTQHRGPLGFDVFRLVLAVTLVTMHMTNHSVWDYKGPMSRYIQLLFRVNTSFTVLSAWLCLRRGACMRKSHSLCRRLWAVLVYAIRRLLILAPLIGFWTIVYLEVYGEDLHINSLFHNHGIYVFYHQNRVECSRPWRKWSSLFLMHDLFFQETSSCHNSSIFEGIFQVDVLIFAMATMLGPRWRGMGACLLWPVAVAAHWNASPGGVRGVPHRCIGLLPAALAVCAVAPSALVASSRGLRKRCLVVIGAVLGLTVTLVLDLYTMMDHDDTIAQWFEQLHPTNVAFRPWSHVYELPHVVGLVLIFGLFEGNGSDATDNGKGRSLDYKKEGNIRPNPRDCLRSSNSGAGICGISVASAIKVCRFVVGHAIAIASRLGPGLCVSHLFVLHYSLGYVYVERVEVSAFQFLTQTAVTVGWSLAISLLVFLVVESPCAYLAAALSDFTT
eukprot:TRINITY_DN13775_c0_g1_i1.p1 TRINITY_DN13775_c0_g1~~TRINITY_DN13775_c0_g1_i1.p1  ORF type:complete len:758 (-),score=68.58 TRINITY_DN13775_c0_g1_i1:273-2546(-)